LHKTTQQLNERKKILAADDSAGYYSRSRLVKSMGSTHTPERRFCETTGTN
jgi:hypothetical protein